MGDIFSQGCAECKREYREPLQRRIEHMEKCLWRLARHSDAWLISSIPELGEESRVWAYVGLENPWELMCEALGVNPSEVD